MARGGKSTKSANLPMAMGKNEGANVRLKVDNQVIEALKHFHEANAFLKSLN